MRVHELRDNEVRAECARRLRRGELELRVLLPAAFIVVEAEELPALEPEPEPAPSTPEPKSAPPPPIEAPAPPPARPWRGDAAAQAQALIEAAREGEPFCEICAKAEAERKAAEEGPVAVAAAAAQIQVLLEAAESATPFCEICEAAKASRAAPPTVAPEPESLAVERVRAAAQAGTLREAAEQGVPFCEVCERAREEEAAR
jgi:hypothetical protein